MTVITVCSSDSSYPPIAHSAADFATAAVASLTEKIMLFSNNNNNNSNDHHPQTNKNKEEENNNNNNTSSMDTSHPMTNDWKDSGVDYDKTSINETKSSLEMENKSMNDNNNHNQGQDDQTMDLSYNNSNNANNNMNDNNNNNNNNSISPISRSLSPSSSPTSRIPLQIVLDMDETMSHYLPNTGTTITTLNLSDVPFFPAVGLTQQNHDSNPDNASYSWLSSSSSYTMNKGTNATFIYSSYPALSLSNNNNNNNNETQQITILLEDGTITPCEKRPLPALGGVVLIRPHFRSFIERLSTDRYYDTTLRIWTAAPQSYADQVLNSIGWHPSIKRYYQQHCAKFLLQRPLFAHRVPEGNNNQSPSSSPSHSASKPSSFEVNDLNVGDMIYLKPISALFHLDGGKKWSPANTILIDNAPYVGLQHGQKQILAPDFIAEPLVDYSLIAYWCQILHHRYPAECGVVLRSIGMDRLEDGIREGKIIIKRIIDDKWMEGKEGYHKIMKSIESLIQQPNNPADLDYFGKISFGEPLR